MRKSLILASLFVFVFTSNVFAADVSGNWVLKMIGRQGEVSIDMVVKATGENLKITAKHPSYGDMVGNGTLKGEAITMTLSTTGETKREYEFKGTVTGNKMAGTREVKMPARTEGSASGTGDKTAARGEGAPSGTGDKTAARGQGTPSGAASQGGAPSGQSGAPSQTISNVWTAEKK
jgi:hypothetical protein